MPDSVRIGGGLIGFSAARPADVGLVIGGDFVALDAIDGGPYTTPAGTTENTALPDPVPVGPRRVRLHDQISGRALRETWSDPETGAWQFSHLRAGRFYVVAFDHTNTYGAVCESDIVLPQPEA